MKKFIDFTTAKMEVLEGKTPILAALSGGQDSCITFLLCLSLKKLAALEIVYCNHFWQPKNFFSSDLIFQLSFLFDVPYTLILPQNGVLGENRSREWRKKSFYRLSHLEKILFTVTGHTRTDTFEKNLNHLFRGTSPKGLRGSTLLISKKSTGLFFSTQKSKPTVMFFREFSFFRYIAQKSKNTLYSKKNTSQLKAIKLKNQFNFSKTRNSKNKFLFSTSGLKEDHNKKTYDFVEKMNSSSFCVSAERHTIQLNSLKPLENIGRSTVSKFLCLYELPVITDVTNFSSNFSRNKIRHHVGPFIQSFLKRKSDYRVTQFFKILSQEHSEIQKEMFSLYCLALLAKSEFNEKTQTTNKSCCSLPLMAPLADRAKKRPFLSDIMPLSKNEDSFFELVEIGLKKSLLHKIFADYKDIELSFLQMYSLQVFTCRND